MASKCTYKLTAKAIFDVEEIANYLTKELCNLPAATKFKVALYKAIDEITEFPESCPATIFVNAKKQKIRKKLIGKYILYYIVQYKTEQIVILRIIHESKDSKYALKHLNYTIPFNLDE